MTTTAHPHEGPTKTQCDIHAEEIGRLRDKGEEQDVVISTVANELQKVNDRIPERLGETLIRFELKLDGMKRDVVNLQRGFVTREEFGIVKVEHDQLKRLVYGFIALALTGIVAAWLGHII